MINWPATKLPSHFTMPFCQRARVVTISSSTHARRGATAVCPPGAEGACYATAWIYSDVVGTCLIDGKNARKLPKAEP